MFYYLCELQRTNSEAGRFRQEPLHTVPVDSRGGEEVHLVQGKVPVSGFQHAVSMERFELRGHLDDETKESTEHFIGTFSGVCYVNGARNSEIFNQYFEVIALPT